MWWKRRLGGGLPRKHKRLPHLSGDDLTKQLRRDRLEPHGDPRSPSTVGLPRIRLLDLDYRLRGPMRRRPRDRNLEHRKSEQHNNLSHRDGRCPHRRIQLVGHRGWSI